MATGSDIGRALVAHRRALGISQRELGERVGVSQPQVARWERSAYRGVALGRVVEVADALGAPLATHPDAVLAAEAAAAYAAGMPGATAEDVAPMRRLGVDLAAIAAFCRSHGIAELAVFGSVLREDFAADSDIDLLVTYAEGTSPGLFGMADQQAELQAMLRRRVDLVTRAAVEGGANTERRAEILGTARTVYAAG
ncbi:MAG: hypothetical protein C0418_06325 [Coriobacteriaceae bacterium]|nr:hypothetical protein [Coriobacteriaceae bacterium]